jgi:hypothetical protein
MSHSNLPAENDFALPAGRTDTPDTRQGCIWLYIKTKRSLIPGAGSFFSGG